MPDRSSEFREKAFECLQLARHASDANERTFLILAQRWFDLGNGWASQGSFDAAQQEFNEAQMTPKRITREPRPPPPGGEPRRVR
jgi:hypothetical protein